jgi:preprotein translocase SecE subunit
MMATQAVKVRNGEGQGGGKPVAGSGFLEGIVGWFRDKWVNSRRFMHEVRVETRQVTWPSVDDVKSTTGVVIVTVFIFAAFLHVVDLSFRYLVEQLFRLFKT